MVISSVECLSYGYVFCLVFVVWLCLMLSVCHMVIFIVECLSYGYLFC